MADRAPLLRIARRELLQGWRHFSTYLACLILGVAVMATIGTLSASIRKAMEAEADSLLGGDVEVTLNTGPATAEQLSLLQGFGEISHVTTMRAMLRHGTAPLLVELKAVDATYPLLGTMRLGAPVIRDEAFSPETLVADASLFHRLGAKPGDKVTIGAAEYRLTGILEKEPDRTVQVFAFGPRVMLSHEALERSGVTKGYNLARDHYRIRLRDKQDINTLRETVEKHFAEGTWRVKTTTDGNDTVDRFLGQLTLFLSLSALATLLIGGIGIGSAMRAYMEKKSASIAVMKTLGASRRQILGIYLAVAGALTMAGGLAGILLSALGSAALLPVIGRWLPIAQDRLFDLPSALLAVWYGALIAMLFSLPALLNALHIRPALLFRHASGIVALPRSARVWPVTALCIALLLATLLLHFDDQRFIAGFAGVAVLAFSTFAAITRLMQHAARRMTVREPWLRLALGNLHRPGSTAGTVMLAIGVSLTVLVAVTLTEANFQQRISEVVQSDAPTLFMMDIQPEQAVPLRELLEKQARRDPLTDEPRVMMYPMVRGSIVALNGKPVSEQDVDEDVRWAIRGDRGLSYAVYPPENATLTQGEWWAADYKGKPLVSVDERFLPGMGLKLGDTITLDILGEEITATIASARRMDYTTFQMNFALMLSPGVIDDFPQSLLSTVYLPADEPLRQQVMRDLSTAFPNITAINTTEAVSQVKDVLEHVATALSISVIVSLIAGLLVLSSALSAMLGYRLYDTAVLKVLGARQRDILLANTGEWMLLAIVTAFAAAGIGTFGAWLIMLRLPGTHSFHLMPEVTLLTLFGCIAVIWLVGYLGNRQVFRLRPARLLRNE